MWPQRRAAWNIYDAHVNRLVEGMLVGQDGLVVGLGHLHSGKQAVFEGAGAEPGVVALAMQVRPHG